MFKRVLSTIFVLLFVIISLPKAVIAEPFAGGDGTAENPYEISTPYELNSVRYYLDADFILLNDIDLSAATAEGGIYWNDGNGWDPAGNLSNPFTGVFDGCGYSIRGLKHKTVSASVAGGLFGFISDAEIRNLGIEDGLITSASLVAGGLAGSASNSQIVNCYNTSNIRGYIVGGLIGQSTNCSFLGCYNTGRITARAGGTALAGGITGDMHSGLIRDCYNAGSVYADYRSGGITGYLSIETSGNLIENSYNIGQISGSSPGGISGYAWYENIINCYYLNNIGYGAGDGVDDAVSLTKEQMTSAESFTGFDFDANWTMAGNQEYSFPELSDNLMMVKSGSNDFSSGNGSSYDPFVIATKDQLDLVRFHLDDEFILINDLIFDDEDYTAGSRFFNNEAGFIPIGSASDPFNGRFNGNGHIISGIKSNVTGDGFLHAGLFGYLSYSIIDNIQLLDCEISVSSYNSSYVGGLSGSMEESIISDCRVSGSISGLTAADAGGLAGKATGGLIQRSINEATINGSHHVGGIAGNITGLQINSCINSGTVSGNGYSGGIAGCIVDRVQISGSNNLGIVTGGSCTGGIAGNIINTGTIIDCTNFPSIDCASMYQGGIVGYGNKVLIQQCRNLGDITSLEGFAGGIAGETGGEIYDCYNTGNISNEYISGGIAGRLHKNSYDPRLQNNIADCFNTGNIRSSDSAGGLIGLMTFSTLKNCYNVGEIADSARMGGVAGWMPDGIIENCYYLDNTTYGIGEGSGSPTTGTIEQFKIQSTFAGFDFISKWSIVEGERYPVLNDLPFVYVTGILLPDSLLLVGDESKTIQSEITPDNATNQNIIWESSDDAVATVANGTIQAVNPGLAIITAVTSDGGHTASCNVTVKSSEIKSDVFEIDYSDSLLKGVRIGTSADQIESGLLNDASDIKIFDHNGAEYSGNLLSSGMKVRLTIDNLIRHELTITILADVSGDGSIDINDILYIRADILNNYSLNAYEQSAADVNLDGEVDITDILYIRAHILGNYDIHRQ